MRSSTLLLLLSGLSLLFLSGCITNEPSVTDPVHSATYLINTLESRTEANISDVAEAFDTTMSDLGFVRTDVDRSEDGRVLTYRGEGDVGVVVKLKAFPDYTNIKIRYGLTGHEHQSRRILDRVIGSLEAEG